MRVWTIGLLLVLATAARGQDMPLSQILIPGETWHEVKLPTGKPAVLAADGKGRVYLADGDRGPILRREVDGKVTTFARPSAPVRGLSFTGDNRLCATMPEGNRIVAYDEKGRELVLGSLTVGRGRDLAVSPSGEVFYIDPKRKAVFRFGDEKPVAEGLAEPAGLAFWRGGGTLIVGDGAGKHLFAFRVGAKGKLDAREAYYTLRVRPKQPSAVRSLALDVQGRLYAATAEGVQVFDPTGRLCGVLARPLRQPVTAVVFGGSGRDRLYVLCGGKLWQRKVKVKGAWPPPASGR